MRKLLVASAVAVVSLIAYCGYKTILFSQENARKNNLIRNTLLSVGNYISSHSEWPTSFECEGECLSWRYAAYPSYGPMPLELVPWGACGATDLSRKLKSTDSFYNSVPGYAIIAFNWDEIDASKLFNESKASLRNDPIVLLAFDSPTFVWYMCDAEIDFKDKGKKLSTVIKHAANGSIKACTLSGVIHDISPDTTLSELIK